MKVRKIITAVVTVLIIGAVITLIVINAINSKFRYNDEGAIGNTTGNLYNGGEFCQYEGYVYFSNAADGNSLYRMKSDGTEVEKLNSDKVSYIQVMNDYIYYVRQNEINDDTVLQGTLHGIFRLEIDEDKPECVYSGIVDTMVICGNYIYFRAYDDENLIQIKCVKVDGQELKDVSDVDYLPLAVNNNTIYFSDVENNYNLMYVEAGKTDAFTSTLGSFYLPTFTKGFMYFIDVENEMRLTRVSLKTNEYQVLDEGKCINFNVSEENDVIYYQLENEDDHKLCRMTLDGKDIDTVAEGNYCNIHITDEYTYYYQFIGTEAKELYRVETNGDTVQQVNFETISSND